MGADRDAHGAISASLLAHHRPGRGFRGCHARTLLDHRAVAFCDSRSFYPVARFLSI